MDTWRWVCTAALGKVGGVPTSMPPCALCWKLVVDNCLLGSTTSASKCTGLGRALMGNGLSGVGCAMMCTCVLRHRGERYLLACNASLKSMSTLHLQRFVALGCLLHVHDSTGNGGPRLA